MEITGSLSPLVPYPSASYPSVNQTGNHLQHRPQAEEQNRPTSASIQQTIKPQAGDYEPERRRFYTQDKDLPHSARLAINSYNDSDFAGGPELMNRVDVYA